MNLVIIYQRIASGHLFKCNLKHKILQSFNNASTRKLYSRKEPSLKNYFSSYMSKINIFRLLKKTTKEELKVKDNIPDQYILIYRSRMDRYILLAQIITTVTSFIVIMGAIFKFDFNTQNQMDFSDWKTPPRQTENEILVYISAFIILLVILQVTISRLPIRIYNLPEQKKYILIFYGTYPFSYKKVVCKVGDVLHLPERGVLPWKQDRYLLKNEQRLILLEQYFRRPADLYIMLGIQKDSDVE